MHAYHFIHIQVPIYVTARMDVDEDVTEDH